MRTTRSYATRVLLFGWCALLPTSAGAQPLSADEIVARSQEAFLAPGEDMNARVTMRLVNKAGRERVREMTMLRKDLEDGDQK